MRDGLWTKEKGRRKAVELLRTMLCFDEVWVWREIHQQQDEVAVAVSSVALLRICSYIFLKARVDSGS